MPAEGDEDEKNQIQGPTAVTGETLFWTVIAWVVILTAIDGVRLSIRVVRILRAIVIPRATEIVSRCGTLGRWVQMTWREPLCDPDEARRALKETCHYSLNTEGYRIVSARPTFRGLRLGVRVVVEQEHAASWRLQYIRTITDPWEWWLVRSAFQTAPNPGRTVSRRPKGLLERLSARQLDRLLSVDPPEDRPTCPTETSPSAPGVRT